MNIENVNNNEIRVKEFNLSFKYSFIQSFLLTFLAELGSNSFVFLIFFREKANKYFILIGALLGEIIMNLLSIFIGYSFDLFIYKSIIDNLSITILIFYSLILLYKISQEKNYSEVTTTENQKKVLLPPLKISNIPNKDYSSSYKRNNKSLTIIPEINEDSAFDDNNLNTPLLENLSSKIFSPNNDNNNIIENSYRNLDTQLTTEEQIDDNNNSIYNTFWITLTQIIFSEFGEKVEICNIVLSATFNVQGVLFGSSFALIIICVIGIFVSDNFILKFLNQRLFNFISAVIILFYGIEIYFFK